MVLLRNLARPALGAAVGIAFGVGWIGFGPADSRARRAPLHQPRLTLEQNKQQLAATQLAAMSRWAVAYRACARAKGVNLGRPLVGDDEVTLKPASDGPLGELVRKLFSCDASLGPPPADGTLTLSREDRLLHVYRPRTCALP